MSQHFFKKVIGQDNSAQEAARQIPQPIELAQPATQEQPQAYRSALTLPPNTRNVLSSDVEIKGSVKFTNDLVVDGKIEGEILSTGNLTIGENAHIKAEIKTGTIVVYGKVHGNLTASDRVELKASAEVVGDIKAKSLSMEAGAIFIGKSTIGSPEATSEKKITKEAVAHTHVEPLPQQAPLAGIKA